MLRSLRIENLVLVERAELDFAAGLNAITGETGAGKTILAQAIGLLLGARGDAGFVGPAGSEAYVEAELDVPGGFLEDDELAALVDVRPEGEDGLTLARRVFADGRTRAYAWGRAVAREDLATAAERLLAMSGQFEQRRLARLSGQFEQRRLARPAYQLDVLDAFAGPDQARLRGETTTVWRALAAAQRRRNELARDAGAAAARLDALRELVADTDGLDPAREDELRSERERLRHATELVEGVAAAAESIAPEDGAGAAALTGTAERALAPLEHLDPDLSRAGDELRELELRLRELGSDLRRTLASLDTDPARLEAVEGELEALADLRRRHRAETTAELLERAAAAREELAGLDNGRDPLEAAEEALATARARAQELAAALRATRERAAPELAAAVAAELAEVGLGEGEFRVELRERELGPSGADEAVFLVRPNRGLGFAPVAQTASGGELSRIALAIAAVGGGETLVFDEIDAGIGGRTAHAVAAVLRRLAERAQVLTITHLPQIASAADRHFRVEKLPGDPTRTRIEQLDEARRRDELERMLGGREFLAVVAGEDEAE